MTDICALHLSHIISTHQIPQRLLSRVPSAKAGAPAQQLAAYDSESGCRGVIYHPNTTITNAGLKVLELAEAMRDIELEEGAQDEFNTPSVLTKNSEHARSVSETHSSPFAFVTETKRRARTVGGHDDTTELALQRARTRIQIYALEESPLRSSEMWQISIKMLCLGRNIQPQMQPFQNSGHPKMTSKIPVQLHDPPVAKKRHLKLSKPQPPRILSQRDTNSKTTSWSWGPDSNMDMIWPKPSGAPIPKMHEPTPREKSCRRRDFSRNNSVISTPTLPDPSDNSNHPLGPHYPQIRDYRTNLPCGFSADIWRRILAYAIDANDVMSSRQQRSMMDWAMDCETLRMEREHLGQTIAGQIWRVLDGTGCLTYDMDD